MKRGVSLVVLVVTIIVLALLTAIVTLSVTGSVENSKLNNFATNMSKIQDSVTSYYVTRGTLPILTSSTVFNKAELLEFVGEEKSSALSTEIEQNGDNESEFYYVDVEKIRLENLPYNITSTSNTLVVNYDGTHVYYIEGYNIEDNIYFSVTKDMK